MKIECTRKRKGGSIVTLGDTRYHFKPVEDHFSPHIETVTIRHHIDTFLAIPEGYRAFGEDVAGENMAGKPDPGESGADDKASADTAVQDIVKPAAPELPVTDQPATADTGSAGLESASDEELRAIFTREVGRKPSGRAGRDTMIDQIRDARAALTA